MKNNDNKINIIETIFISLFKFETIIKNIKNSYNYEINYVEKGYLINLKEYENLKNVLNNENLYNLYIEGKKNLFDKKINELILLNKLKDNNKLKLVKINSINELIKLIKNKNEYILIDEDLMKIICVQNKNNYYNYKINNNILKLYIEKDNLNFYYNY